jgi:REP element-mobilizing transposase RayT
MARPLRIEYPGAFYHVTSRGNERKAVFKSLSDRERFLTYLESATERYGAVIHVYCLMDTHYHLFIETPSGKLSRIMQHINGAYTTYFNRKRERSGHLFQGRYMAILVEADEYAMELSRYVHLNPVRAWIVKTPEEYKWSSFRYYISNGKAPKWLKRDFILSYFGGKPTSAMKKYRDFVYTLLEKEYESPLAKLPHSVILGSSEFVAEIKDRFIRGKQPERDLPILTEMIDRPGLETIEQAVDSRIQNDANLARQVKMFLCHRYSGKKLSEIGARFGVSQSAVTQASRRMRDRQHKDKKLEKLILKIVKKLPLSIV